MTRLSLFAIIFSFCITISAQQYDEYISRLEDVYTSNQYASVLFLADSLVKNDVTPHIARVYQIKADAYYFLNDVESSLANYLKALSLDQAESFPLFPNHRKECVSHVGFCYRYLGNYVEAIPYYKKAYSLSIADQDSIEIANQASSLGTIYSSLGEYEKAYNYFEIAYEIDFALKDTVALAYDLVNLGSLQLAVGDTEKAIVYLKKGLSIKDTKAGDHTIHIQRLSKLSNAFLKADAIDSALHYVSIAKRESIAIKDSLSLAKLWIIESEIKTRQKEFLAAKQTAQKAFDYFKETPSDYQVRSEIALSYAHIELKEYWQALSILKDALAIAQRLELVENEIKIFKMRSEINEKLDRPQLVIDDLKAYQALKDTLQETENQQAIFILDQEYQTAQKEAEIEQLSLETQLQKVQLKNSRIILIVSIVGILILVGLLLIIYIQRHKKQKIELESQELQIEALEKRLLDLNISPSKPDVKAEDLNGKINSPLSSREFEVLKLTLEGKSNGEIAEILFLSVSTIKFHLRNTYGKLGVNNRKEALDYVVKSS